MPLTSSQLVTAAAAAATRNVASPSGDIAGGQIVTVMLRYEIPFVPTDLINALLVQYGSGKVTSMKDTVTHAHYHLSILP